MHRIISLILLTLTLQVVSHKCVLRDTPHAPAVTLQPTRINDDYCDCQDGSDETTTSACPNGTFTCINAAYHQKKIPSSWLHDGSCDCCDGSDEPPGTCSDTCALIRKREFRNAKQNANSVLRGVKTRQSYMKLVEGALEKDARELRKLQRELGAVEGALNESRRRADGLRKRRDWQPRPNVVNSHTVNPGRKEESGKGHEPDHDMYDYDYEGKKGDENKGDENKEDENRGDENRGDVENGNDDPSERDEEGHDDDLDAEEDEDKHDDDDDDDLEDQIDDDDLEDQIDDDEEDEFEEEDYEDLYNDIDEDEVITSTKAEEEKGTKQQDKRESSTEKSSQPSVSPSESEKETDSVPEPTFNVDSVCADLETASSNSVFRIFSYARAVLRTKLNRILPKVFPVKPGSAISGLEECIRQADSAKWKLESQKTDLEEKIKKLREKQTIDYGTDKALRKLHGECTKSKVMQYEFEHCAFDIVRQYEHGSAIATLGRFDGWEIEDGERFMKYKNGNACWNGPSRSTKVQLLCGEKEDIVSVDEPNRCTYFMKFRTPAVCEKEMADRIMLPFEQGSEQKDEL